MGQSNWFCGECEEDTKCPECGVCDNCDIPYYNRDEADQLKAELAWLKGVYPNHPKYKYPE